MNSFELAGDKELNRFRLFGSGHEAAVEFYSQAAAAYTVDKKFQEAGAAFVKAASCHLKLNDPYEAACSYADAGRCYGKVSPSDARTWYLRAVEILQTLGKISMVARYHVKVAKIYETELNHQEAMKHYSQAADLFSAEDAEASALECKLKVATYAGLLEQYSDAIEEFEEAARKSISNSLRQFSVKDYLLNAGICQLARGDTVSCIRAVERYGDLDPSWSQSRQGGFYRKMVEAQDVETFTQAVTEFDSLIRLNDWRTTLLLRVKRRMTEEQENLL